MKGADGTAAPFFTGHGVGVSKRLLREIIDTDWAHTVLFDSYGTNMDDANLGKWVQHAAQKKPPNGLHVDYKVIRGLLVGNDNAANLGQKEKGRE